GARVAGAGAGAGAAFAAPGGRRVDAAELPARAVAPRADVGAGGAARIGQIELRAEPAAAAARGCVGGRGARARVGRGSARLGAARKRGAPLLRGPEDIRRGVPVAEGPGVPEGTVDPEAVTVAALRARAHEGRACDDGKDPTDHGA